MYRSGLRRMAGAISNVKNRGNKNITYPIRIRGEGDGGRGEAGPPRPKNEEMSVNVAR